MSIFSMDGVETRFGRLDGKAIGTSGYRLLAGSADPSLNPQELHVQDGQLMRRVGGRDVPIDDVDYLVLAFEHRSTLIDDTFSLVEVLPFHAHWRAAMPGAIGVCEIRQIEIAIIDVRGAGQDTTATRRRSCEGPAAIEWFRARREWAWPAWA